MDKKTFKLRPLHIIVTVVVSALLILPFLAIPNAGAAESKGAQGSEYHKAEYKSNADGQSFGSALDAQSLEKMPDLIAVVATNGEEGYILSTDYAYARDPNPPKNPEEATAMMKARELKAVKAFAKSIYDQTGMEMDLEEVKYMLNNLNNSMDCDWRSYETINKKQQADMTGIVFGGSAQKSDGSDSRTEAVIATALQYAGEANQIVIPVYMEDGRTIIGEFIIQLY
jgi:hypothetical protein